MPAAMDLIPQLSRLDHPKKQGDLSAFIDGYTECLLWSSYALPDTEEGEPEHADQFDLSSEAKEEVTKDCINFLIRAGKTIHDTCEKYHFYNWAQAGHDFALTRNGHGVGYWDRGIDKLGDTLTQMAEDEGGTDLYIIDGELYQQ